MLNFVIFLQNNSAWYGLKIQKQMYHICVCFLFLHTSCNKEESDIEWYQEIKINQLPNITYIKKNPQSSLKTIKYKRIFSFLSISVYLKELSNNSI